MNKKLTLTVVMGVILITALILGGLPTFSNPDRWLTVWPQTPQQKVGEPWILSEEEYHAMPAVIRNSLDGNVRNIVITGNPFISMKSKTPVLSPEEAEELFTEYAIGFIWNDTFYGFGRMVT